MTRSTVSIEKRITEIFGDLEIAILQHRIETDQDAETRCWNEFHLLGFKEELIPMLIQIYSRSLMQRENKKSLIEALFSISKKASEGFYRSEDVRKIQEETYSEVREYLLFQNIRKS